MKYPTLWFAAYIWSRKMAKDLKGLGFLKWGFLIRGGQVKPWFLHMSNETCSRVHICRLQTVVGWINDYIQVCSTVICDATGQNLHSGRNSLGGEHCVKKPIPMNCGWPNIT
eukprot:TRINITY_DN33455_c0_g2_i1.p1 TRINITY_DN33455_c0_g2~~TRINITY_DN33455_c0_g2_i1.p1  ORF type:complete len:112 (+),score=9.87 TRINITY_DN33455_c0_g2_i1:641-976(+)